MELFRVRTGRKPTISNDTGVSKEFQESLHLIDNGYATAEWLRRNDLRNLTRSELLHLLIRLSQISGDRHGMDGYIGFIRDELNERRTSGHEKVTRIISWLALAASVFIPLFTNWLEVKP